jgi:MFS family permease
MRAVSVIKNQRALGIWMSVTSFVLFQFFLQLSSGAMVKSLMNEFALSAFATGILSSAYYYIYVTLQVPVGMLFDKYGTRLLLSAGAFCCSIGCILFARSHHYLLAFAARVLMGAGASFSFVGLLHIIRDNFPLKRYALMVGLTETLGLSTSIIGTIYFAIIINQFGWRIALFSLGFFGLAISWLCYKVIPESKNNPVKIKAQLIAFIKTLNKPVIWLNGLYVGIVFSIITVFAALWATPFIQLKFNTNLTSATTLSTMVFLGAAVGLPLFGHLSSSLKRRKPLMVFSCISTTVLLCVVLYLPITSMALFALLMVSIGVCCSSYLLTFSIAEELAPAGMKSTYTGFTNALAVITAPLLQPLIGWLLDKSTHTIGIYHLIDYQKGLAIIPISIIIATFIAFVLPEKPH